MHGLPRLLLVLMLAVALPLSGAMASAPMEVCPDHQAFGGEMSGADMPHHMPHHMPDRADMAGADSCCDPERSAALGYPVCKPGQENCHGLVLFYLPTVVNAVPVLFDKTRLASSRPSAPRDNAESFWRPPRA